MRNHRRWEKMQISRVEGILETWLKLRYERTWIGHGDKRDYPP